MRHANNMETQTPPLETPLPVVRPDWRDLLTKLGSLIGLLFVFLLFAVLVQLSARGRPFATAGNAELMLRQTAVVGVAALGMTLVIISGGIDLSVGSVMALAGVVAAMVLRAGHSATLAAACGVAAASACGLINGALITGLRLTPFIVTLGMWGAVRGVAKLLADSTNVYPPQGWVTTWLAGLLRLGGDSPLWVRVLMAIAGLYVLVHFAMAVAGVRRWMLARSVVAVALPAAVAALARALYGYWPLFPPGVWLTLALAVLVAATLRYTRFGRHVFAVGSNEQTARLCGVRVGRTKVLVYLLGSASAGVAGLLELSYLSIGDPTTRLGAELDVIAAVVIGGASLAGGQGSVFGSLVGALIMTMVANGCTKLDLPNPVQEIATGGIIIAAAALDRLRHRGSA
jgi:ribose transport system permease protein